VITPRYRRFEAVATANTQPHFLILTKQNKSFGDQKTREALESMRDQLLLSVIVVCLVTGAAHAQQAPDLKYRPPLPRPAYEGKQGPRVAIDEAHHNFHTADGRYKPFAEFLRRDGYRVTGLAETLSADSLESVDVLVIANPLNRRNVKNWSLPTPSAFTRDEIVALRTWTEQGGSLFLIADHFPFPGAAGELAKAFGVEFSNGFATPGNRKPGQRDTFEYGTGLMKNAITRGRADKERITKVATFVGSAFKLPKDATAILVFGDNSVSLETRKASERTFETPPKVSIDGWCQGAVLKIGSGRVALFGEAAMFSAQLAGARKRPMGMNAPEAKQNHQLLLNVMHWLTRAKGMPD
jgi:hypothetical protein